MDEDCPRCPQCSFPLCSQACLALKTLHSDEECRILSASGLGKLALDGAPEEEMMMVYCCIFLLRTWLLKSQSEATWRRLDFLMDGNTRDLMDEDSFTVEIANIMQAKMGLTQLTREEIVKLMGIKRTNASTLLAVGLPGTTQCLKNYQKSLLFARSKAFISKKNHWSIIFAPCNFFSDSGYLECKMT